MPTAGAITAVIAQRPQPVLGFFLFILLADNSLSVWFLHLPVLKVLTAVALAGHPVHNLSPSSVSNGWLSRKALVCS